MRKLLLLILLVSSHAFAQSLETDRQALVAIYNATMTGTSPYGVGNFNDITGWNVPGSSGDSPCGWSGVTCEGGRVTRLDLSAFQVHGPLAAEVGNLSELKYLNLMMGGLESYPMYGELPLTMANLQNLEYLELRGNDFSGTNLHVLGGLTKLTYFAIDTPVDWTIPGSFQNLTNLEHFLLNVRGGMAWPELGSVGPIPSFFGNFTKLKTLYMPWAGLTGPLPSFLGNLVNLEVLNLRHNSLQSTIPASFSNLAKLTTLNLAENHLYGPIPSLAGIPASAVVSINNNWFNFDGMQSNIGQLGLIDNYSPQAKLMMSGNFPLGGGSFQGDLFVYAGGTEANNTYRWYKNEVLQATNVGVRYFQVSEQAVYRVEVTNSMVPGLTLVSEDFTLPAMPVTLISFTGKSEEGQGKFVWKTTSETNNKGFEIERSADARTFEKIGFVDGNGDSKEVNTYHFVDLKPLPNGYYRLKQLDHDGKFEYSKIIMLKSSRAAISIYPNPASDQVIVSGLDGVQDLLVVNGAGRTVLKTQVSAGKPISIQSLKPGLYTIKIGTEAGRLLISK